MATIRPRYNRQGDLIGYQAIVRRKGFPVRYETKESHKEAEDWAAIVEGEMVKGDFVDRRKSHEMTLGDAIDEFIRAVAPTHKGGNDEIARLNRFKREDDKLCQYALAKLPAHEIERYRDNRLSGVGYKKAVAPGSIARELNLLSRVVKNVATRVNLAVNPFSEVKRPVVNDARHDARIAPDDEKKLFDVIGKTRNPIMRHFLVVAIESAMRRGEMLSLKWADVDLERRTARLDKSNTKTAKARTVPLSARAVESLHSLWDRDERDPSDERVFSLGKDAVRHCWERLRKRAGLEHLHLHDARHEGATRRHEAGWDIMQIRAFTGHEDLRMVQRYVSVSADSLVGKLRAEESTVPTVAIELPLALHEKLIHIAAHRDADISAILADLIGAAAAEIAENASAGEVVAA